MSTYKDEDCAAVGLPAGRSGEIIKWNVDIGDSLYLGQEICVYKYTVSTNKESGQVETRQKILKTGVAGEVARIVVQENQAIGANEPAIMIKEGCKHELVSMGLCNDCGADVTFGHFAAKKVETVSMIHGVPGLHVSQTEAYRIGQMDKQRLMDQRKLVLILDLDQTLLHATASVHVDQWLTTHNYPRKDIVSFTLPSAPTVFWVKLRPYARELLAGLSSLYELHIYTHGSREYALQIASILDASGKMFGNRILSRDDGFDQMHKSKALSSLFPQGDDMVVILDDRSDVWQDVDNLVKVVPYVFFNGVPDLNATPQDIKRAQAEERRNAQLKDLAKNKEGDKNANSTTSTTTTDSTTATQSNTETPTPTPHPPHTAEKSESSEVTDLIHDPPTAHDASSSAKEASTTTTNTDTSATKSGAARGNTRTDNPVIRRLREVIASVHAKVKDTSVPEADLEAWRKHSLSTAIKSVSKLLNESRFNDAVLRLGAVRQAFNSVETIKEESRRRLGASRAEDEQVLVDMYLELQRRDPLLNGAAPKDNDEVLMYLEPVLKGIHASYFSQAGEQYNTDANVKTIIPLLRKEVLSGCTILFSSLIPQKEVPEHNPIWVKATSFGAVCVKELDELVTHVVAMNGSTEKVKKAADLKTGVCVVHYDWLKESMNTWTRQDEDDFPLLGVPVRNKGYEMQLASEHTQAHRKLSFAELDVMDAEVDELMSSDDEEESQPAGNLTESAEPIKSDQIAEAPSESERNGDTKEPSQAPDTEGDVHGLGLSDDDDSSDDEKISTAVEGNKPNGAESDGEISNDGEGDGDEEVSINDSDFDGMSEDDDDSDEEPNTNAEEAEANEHTHSNDLDDNDNIPDSNQNDDEGDASSSSDGMSSSSSSSSGSDSDSDDNDNEHNEQGENAGDEDNEDQEESGFELDNDGVSNDGVDGSVNGKRKHSDTDDADDGSDAKRVK